MDGQKYPGHIEFRLDRRTGEVYEEFIPDDKYVYVNSGVCREKNNALFIDAVMPPAKDAGKWDGGSCQGMFYGYVSTNRRYPYERIVTLYPFCRCGDGMHEKLFTKRRIPAGRVISKQFYKERYGQTYSVY